jgi:hypothetical protein
MEGAYGIRIAGGVIPGEESGIVRDDEGRWAVVLTLAHLS